MTASGGFRCVFMAILARMAIPSDGSESGLFDGDGVFFADFHAAFTAKALLGINRHGFAVFHFENFHRTYIDTLFATNAFLLINSRNKCHRNCLL
jgi:hypothetical protein